MNHEDLKGGRKPLKLRTAPEGSKPATMPKEPDVREYIDMTPTWSGVLPLLLAGLEGGARGRTVAIEELHRMAQAADRWNAHCAALGEDKANG